MPVTVLLEFDDDVKFSEESKNNLEKFCKDSKCNKWMIFFDNQVQFEIENGLKIIFNIDDLYHAPKQS